MYINNKRRGFLSLVMLICFIGISGVTAYANQLWQPLGEEIPWRQAYINRVGGQGMLVDMGDASGIPVLVTRHTTGEHRPFIDHINIYHFANGQMVSLYSRSLDAILSPTRIPGVEGIVIAEAFQAGVWDDFRHLVMRNGQLIYASTDLWHRSNDRVNILPVAIQNWQHPLGLEARLPAPIEHPFFGRSFDNWQQAYHAVATAMLTGANPQRSIALHDLDQDGVPELFVAHESAIDGPTVWHYYVFTFDGQQIVQVGRLFVGASAPMFSADVLIPANHQPGIIWQAHGDSATPSGEATHYRLVGTQLEPHAVQVSDLQPLVFTSIYDVSASTQIANWEPAVAVVHPTLTQVVSGIYTTPISAFSIGGTTYVRLRDLAIAAGESTLRFDIAYDGTIGTVSVLTGRTLAGDIATISTEPAPAIPADLAVLVDGVSASLNNVYRINSSLYVPLRGFLEVIDSDININWDASTQMVSVYLPALVSTEVTPFSEPEVTQPTATGSTTITTTENGSNVALMATGAVVVLGAVVGGVLLTQKKKAT